jgi:hypothetical protein
MTSHSTDRGELRITVYSPRVSLNVVRGSLDRELVRPLLESANGWLALGGAEIHGFNDWEAMTDYDLGGRVDITAWTLTHRRRFRGMHFLVQSRAVRIGIDIANFALGRFMTVPPDRHAFEEALHEQLGPRHRPVRV